MTRFQPAALVLAALTTSALLAGVGALADTQYQQVVAQSSPERGTAVAVARASASPVLVVVGQRVSL